MGLLLLALVAAVIGAAIYWTPVPWQDDGDCTRIVQHTVRVPAEIERHALWWSRYYLIEETQGEPAVFLPIILPPSKILQ